MKNSSSERVVPAEQVGTVDALPTPELRSGVWTRLGTGTALGDGVTEAVLGAVAERVRAAATAEGYAVGWSQGRREAAAAAAQEAQVRAAEHAAAEARREAEHRAAVGALEQAAADVRAELRRLAEAVEGQATTLAWAITEEILGREVRVVDAADVVRRVLDVLPTTPVARVRLHPSVAEDPAVKVLLDRDIQVVADAGLDRGDALVDCDGAVVDLRIDEAMARVREVLAP